MEKRYNFFIVSMLLLNLISQPFLTLNSVYADDGGESYDYDSSEQIDNYDISSESIVEEIGPEEVISEPSAESSFDEEDYSESDYLEEPQEDDLSEEEEDTQSEEETSEEEKNPLSSISYIGGNETTNLRTGSEAYFSFNVTNQEADLEDAIIRITLPAANIDYYNDNSLYFPNQGLEGRVSSQIINNQLVLDIDAGTLVANYQQNFNLVFKTLDDGTSGA